MKAYTEDDVQRLVEVVKHFKYGLDATPDRSHYSVLKNSLFHEDVDKALAAFHFDVKRVHEMPIRNQRLDELIERCEESPHPAFSVFAGWLEAQREVWP